MGKVLNLRITPDTMLDDHQLCCSASPETIRVEILLEHLPSSYHTRRHSTTPSPTPPKSNMPSPPKSKRPTTSPSSSSSPEGGHLSRQNSANATSSGVQRQSSTQQSSSGQATRSLADVLTERSDSLALSLFGGLVDASDNLSADKKQDLKWIKVEPGQSPKSPTRK